MSDWHNDFSGVLRVRHHYIPGWNFAPYGIVEVLDVTRDFSNRSQTISTVICQPLRPDGSI